MNGEEFVAGLGAEIGRLFARLGEQETLESESQGRLEVATLLKLALASELETAELAGLWLPSTAELEAKMLLARQCHDEMRHYELISGRLRELGEDLSGFDPVAGGHSPLYRYLQGLETTVERVAAGPFAGEALAEVRNAQFIRFCRAVGDAETARLYEQVIQPEEVHHHRLAGELLARLAIDEERQLLAAEAARSALAIADELRTLTEKSTGMHHIPTS